MKKWLIGLIVINALALACIYIFIPSKLPVAKIMQINCTSAATRRFLLDEDKWPLWWTDTLDLDGKPIPAYNRYTYHIIQKQFNSVDINIQSKKYDINSRITILPLSKDSVALEWRCELETTINPLKRLDQYRQATVIKKNMTTILVSLRSFLEQNIEVYGADIQKIKVKDTLLIATKTDFVTYPTVEEIYSLLNKLKIHITKAGAHETGYPMLNVRQTDNSRYETMVAIPVNKAIPETDSLFTRRMIPGNILIAEVQGGPATIKQALTQIETYVADHQLESPAKPFQSLVTDRLAEYDTTKWITRIYYPVF
jgi:hypothetical protein